MNSEKRNALIGLNIAIAIMSIAGLFAKLIPWPAVMIILGRASLTAPFLAAYLVFTKKSLRLKSRKHMFILMGLGIMMVTHWVTYFQAIQVSTVAIGILAVFTSPIIITFLEPLFDGHNVHGKDVLLALVAFAGIVLMIDDFSLGSGTVQGVLFGITSALIVSLRNIWSKCLVKEYEAPLVMFWQMVFGALFLSPLLFFYTVDVQPVDIKNLLILACFATAIAHTLMLKSVAHIGARATGVIMMVQPLYAIVLAVLLLGEIPTLHVIAGGVLVMSAMIFETVQQTR
ncbi:MAG: DMT family transporter [bacterium]|nr:DMT family transporter [bacterium]